MFNIGKRVLDPSKYEVDETCKCGEPLKFYGFESTLVGFTSPPGHTHDDNCRSAVWGCSTCRYNGHMVYHKIRNFCQVPDCTWQGREECGVCHDTKPPAHTKVIDHEAKSWPAPWKSAKDS